MKRLLILLIFNVQFADAQNMNSVWVFGDSAGIDFNNINNPTSILTGIDSRGSCTSIADSNGNLLLYAFTRAGIGNRSTLIYNNQNQLVQNGDTISGEAWYNELTIIPNPGNSHLYYLFSMGEVFSFTQGFYYSIIDMAANGGLGNVIQKNVQLNNFRNADCVTAIKHGNGRDWWVFSKYSNTNGTTFNRFNTYLITPASIFPPIIQDFNNATDADVQRIVFNSTGTKLMQINIGGFMCEYDFDRCTGLISNPNIIFPEQTGPYNRTFWSGAYSPDGSKFYVSANPYSLAVSDTSRLLQFDLNAPNIPASCDTLFTITYYATQVQGGTVRLAPNGKIYYASIYFANIPNGYPYPDSIRNVYNENLGVINQPDSADSACDFQPFSFNLGGKRVYVGLPNNPDYGMPRIVGSACDTVWAGIPPTPEMGVKSTLYVSYINPWQKAFINAQRLIGTTYTLTVTDMIGRQVFKQKGKLHPPYFTKGLDCNGFSNGMYIVTLTTNKEQLSQKFIKE